MKISHNSPVKSSSYGVGALSVIVASLGTAAIVYSIVLRFDIYSLSTWIFGPLGAYTLAYSVITRRNSLYYLVWGSIMVVIALASELCAVVSPFVMLGILAIVMAIIGIFAYQRNEK